MVVDDARTFPQRLESWDFTNSNGWPRGPPRSIGSVASRSCRSGFERRVVPMDQRADASGRPLAGAQQAGRGLGAMDALIAATCLACDLVLATRNPGDFEELSVELFAP